MIKEINDCLKKDRMLPVAAAAQRVIHQRVFAERHKDVRAAAGKAAISVARAEDGTETYSYIHKGRLVEASLHPQSNWRITIDGEQVARRNRGKTLAGTLRTHLGLPFRAKEPFSRRNRNRDYESNDAGYSRQVRW